MRVDYGKSLNVILLSWGEQKLSMSGRGKHLTKTMFWALCRLS